MVYMNIYVLVIVTNIILQEAVMSELIRQISSNIKNDPDFTALHRAALPALCGLQKEQRRRQHRRPAARRQFRRTGGARTGNGSGIH